MMILIKNAEVYSPECIGKRDVLVGGGKILAMEESLSPNLPDVEVYDAEGKKLVPGFIDQHVHFIGGGGEGGFHTRTPELLLSDVIKAGVTTMVGVLGTDGITRSVEALVAKTKALNNEGVTAYCLTSAYQVPPVTITGSVMNDIAFIDEIIGCKIALSDHRGSHPTREELVRMVSDVRMAGLISGKVGVLHIHTGITPQGIEPIMEIIRETDITPYHFRPTHLGNHIEQAIEFTKIGGYADFTAGERCLPHFSRLYKEADTEKITISSDSNGSIPKWDEKRQNIIGIGVGKITTLFEIVRRIISEQGVPFETALSFITSNVAKALQLYPRKGCIAAGSDADLVFLDENLEITSVIAKGCFMMRDKEMLKKGTFED